MRPSWVFSSATLAMMVVPGPWLSTATGVAAAAALTESQWLTPTSGAFFDASRWSAGVPGVADTALFGPEPSAVPYLVDIAIGGQGPSTIPIGGLIVEGQHPRLQMGPALTGVFQVLGPLRIAGSLEVGGGIVQCLGPTTIGGDGAVGTFRVDAGTMTANALAVGVEGGEGHLEAGPGGGMYLLGQGTATLPNVLVGSGGIGSITLAPSGFGAGGGVWVIGADDGQGEVALSEAYAPMTGVVRLGGDGSGPRGPGYGIWTQHNATVGANGSLPGLEFIVGSEGFGALQVTGNAASGSHIGAVPLVVGDEGGTGVFTVAGTASVGGTAIVGRAGGRGTLVASGPGTVLSVGGLALGSGGDGTLIVQEQAGISVGTGQHAYGLGGSATIVVSGGSYFNGGFATVGDAQAAPLTLSVGVDDGPMSQATWSTLGRVVGVNGESAIDITVGGSGSLSINTFVPSRLPGARIDVHAGGTLSIGSVSNANGNGAAHEIELWPGSTFTSTSFRSDPPSRLILHRTALAAPSIAWTNATVSGELALHVDDGWVPDAGAIVPLVAASTSFEDRLGSFDLPVWHGYPPIVISTGGGRGDGLAALSIDHVDAIECDLLPSVWVGLAAPVSVHALVDGVSYDITRQAEWSFDPPIVTMPERTTMVGIAPGRTVGTVRFGASERSVAIVVRADTDVLPHTLVSSTGDAFQSLPSATMSFTDRCSAFSFDGQSVAFESSFAPFAGDFLAIQNTIFVKDLATGVLEVPLLPAGGGPPLTASSPSLSRDGRFLAFVSPVDLLSSGGPSSTYDVYLLDRLTGAIELISKQADGAPALADSAHPEVSADGRFVTFQTPAKGLVEDDGNALTDVFRWDRWTQTMLRASTTSLGVGLPASSTLECVTPDGRFVFFLSNVNGLPMVLRKDCDTGDLLLATPGYQQTVPYAVVQAADASADGRFVLFRALGPGRFTPLEQPWSTAQLFLRDLALGITTAISLDDEGEWFATEVFDLAIDDAGRYAVFVTAAPNAFPESALPAGPGASPLRSAFRVDLVTGARHLLSTSAVGPFDRITESTVDISGDGLHVLFATRAANVLPFDGENSIDLFVFRAMPSISADLDGDGLVGPSDLAILLSLWGSEGARAGEVSADLDGDGVVTAGDLAALLAAWSA